MQMFCPWGALGLLRIHGLVHGVLCPVGSSACMALSMGCSGCPRLHGLVHGVLRVVGFPCPHGLVHGAPWAPPAPWPCLWGVTRDWSPGRSSAPWELPTGGAAEVLMLTCISTSFCVL